MNTRNIIFWIKDWLQGGQIRKFYNDLKRSFEDEEYDNSKQLKYLLDYAILNIEFYKNLKGETRLDSFPVVNKAIIKQNYTKFQSPLYKIKKLHVESTSGSTGTPFKIYQNQEKRKRAAADMIFFSKFAGYEIGTKLYYCRVWNNLNRKSKISSVLQNIIMKDSSKLSDEEMMRFIKILEKDKSKKSILIFASTLTSLYKFVFKNELKSNTKINQSKKCRPVYGN